jgi:hypothetical protein
MCSGGQTRSITGAGREAVYLSAMSAYAKLPEVEKRVSDTVAKVASDVGNTVQTGLSGVSRELGAPAGADVAALIAEANLPELAPEEALPSLARRLDREADLWRNLALRELAHVAWANRIAHLASAMTMFGVAALAVIAAILAFFGAAAPERSLLLGVGALVLVMGAGAALWLSSSVRKSQREVVRDALVRADLAELRLHRIAVAMASMRAEGEIARSAIARLERDVTG